MPSTYTTNNGIEKIATGEQSGTWGDTTNVNFDLLDEALDGQVSVALTGTGTSGSPNDLEITDGTSSNGRNRFVEFTGTPGGDTYVRLTPNDAEKVLFIQNSTNQTLLLFQGTYAAARDYPLEAGRNAVVRFTGTGTTSYAYNALEDLKVSTLETDILSVSDDSTGEVIITSTAVPTLLRVQSNEDGADGGPRIDLYRNSSTPADNDRLGQIYFSGEDDGGGKHQYAKIEGFAEDVSAGSEGGRLNLNILSGGSGMTMLMLRSDTGGTDGEVVINEDADSVNFRIQGSSNANLFVTDAANNAVVVGHDTGEGIGGTPPPLQVVGITGATSSMGILRNQNTSSGPSLRFARSRASTKGDVTIVQDDDQLGAINFYGADGTDYASIGAQIIARVDGTPGVDDMPGSLEFWTTADGDNTATERMRIDSNGNVGIGGNPSTSRLRVFGATPYFDIQDTTSGSWDQNDVFSGIRFRTSDPDVGGSGQTHAYIKAIHTRSGTGHSNPDAGLVFGTSDGTTPTAIERMRITNDGFIGINETNPTAPLHITRSDNSDLIMLECTDGDATEGPQMHLYRNTASPADGDDIGVIKFRGKNSSGSEINYVEIAAFTTDVTAGSEDAQYRVLIQKNGNQVNALNVAADEVVVNENSYDIDFRVESNNATNMLKVDANNNQVYINSSSEITSTSTTLNVTSSSSGRTVDLYRSSSTASNNVLNVYSNFGGTKNINASIDVDGDMENTNNRYTGFSDQRFKQDIVDATSQWDDIKALQVRKYRFINLVEQLGDDAPVHLGVIAQELEASGMGGLVKTKPMDEDNPDAGDRKSVAYSVLYMKAVKALQEAMERIETLETKVAALEAE